MTDADRRLFVQPLALGILGRYIIRLNRDALGRWRPKRSKDGLQPDQDKPLVIIIVHPRGGAEGPLASILAMPVMVKDNMEAHTLFHDHFQRASELASEAGAVIAAFADGFNSCSVIVNEKDKGKLLRALDDGVGAALTGSRTRPKPRD